VEEKMNDDIKAFIDIVNEGPLRAGKVNEQHAGYNREFSVGDMPKGYGDFILDLKDQVDQYLLQHEDKYSEEGEKVHNSLSNLSDYLADMAEGRGPRVSFSM
jgi:hypothetical protein